MSKRNEFIIYLLDLGLDIDSQNDEIKAYYDDELLLSVGEWGKYWIRATGKFEEYFKSNASEVFMKMAEYSCIDIEDRSKINEQSK